jgi:hypothetical protein
VDLRVAGGGDLDEAKHGGREHHAVVGLVHHIGAVSGCSATTRGQIGHVAGATDGGNLGESSRYMTWVCVLWVRKIIRFW